MTNSLSDVNGVTIRPFAHIRICMPRHKHYGRTGTAVRVDPTRNLVWVALPGGIVIRLNRRSVQVVVPRS
jgi:hypothetical protein